MANSDGNFPDMAEILKTMQAQMETMQNLQRENQRLHQTIRTTQEGAAQHSTSTKRKPPNRPSIEVSMEEADWAIFIDSWSRYKLMTNLSDPVDIKLELRAACSLEVNKLLLEFVGATTLNSTALDEDELIAHIRSVAVKIVHKEVHRINFGRLSQSSGEKVTHFVARLKAQAALCGFNVNCQCQRQVPYTEDMVAQQLVADLGNKDHQGKILG